MTEIPQLWWSQREGLVEPAGRGYRQVFSLRHIAELPADAVRLVPESEVQFVLDDNERMLAQHAADVAEIDRLRSELDHADHFGRGEFRVTSWAYEQVCRTDREKGEKIADLMRQVAELRAGAVPDTGQARLADDWDRYAEGIRQQLRDPYEPADPEAAGQASMYNRCATELREVLDRASASASASVPDTGKAHEPAITFDDEVVWLGRRYVAALNAVLCAPPGSNDVDRWRGHAEAFRQVAEQICRDLNRPAPPFGSEEWRAMNGIYSEAYLAELREIVRRSAGPSGDTVQAPDVAACPGLCPTCDSSQPHLHPHRDLCPDSWHQPVPTTSDEWRTEVHRWAGLLDQIVEHDIGSDAVRRLSEDMRRALLGTDTTPGEKR